MSIEASEVLACLKVNNELFDVAMEQADLDSCGASVVW
jgi:hypothetical protein